MIKCKDIHSRFDLDAFVMPPEYIDDEEEKSYEQKLLICRLFIDCFKILTFEEFQALQGVLIIEQCWDRRATAPVNVCGGMFRTNEEQELSLSICAKLLDTDKEKLCALMKSVLEKLPIAKTFLSKEILDDIESKKTLPIKESSKFKIEKDKFDAIGKNIRKGLYKLCDSFVYACDFKRGK